MIKAREQERNERIKNKTRAKFPTVPIMIKNSQDSPTVSCTINNLKYVTAKKVDAPEMYNICFKNINVLKLVNIMSISPEV